MLPSPVFEKTLMFEAKQDECLKKMTELGSKALPISGLCFDGNVVYARLSGSEKAVLAAEKTLRGSAFLGHSDFWRDLRDHRLPFFPRGKDLWRFSVAPAVSQICIEGDWFYDWGGAQRWLKSDEPADAVFTAAEEADGHAALFHGKGRSGEVFQPLPEKLRQLNFNLKQAFDPDGILNPNRMNRDW